jgi:TolB-like protein/Tfp pilus assembly protein PilF
MSSLFHELKRRNVYKVALAYIVVGWVVLQVAEFLSPLLQLPEWTVSLALYLGLLGFPFALIFAWAFELTPEGLRLTEKVSRDESITAETGKSLNRTIITLMAVAIVLLLGERLLSSSQTVESDSGQQAVAGKRDTGAGSSIAVLPFVNMSKDPDQEYFSDGISEELLNGLAKIQELRVAARTSSFAFKGQNTDITKVGRELNVETVLEGSVRKSGNRVRITAQLINVEDGYHLWSETYDRELTDIFAIQDEISRNIVDALKVHLTDEEIAAVTPAQSAKPANVEAYNFFLLGKHNLRLRNESSLKLAIRQFEQALDRDPGYAEAYASQALATHLLSASNYGKLPGKEANRQAQALLDRALALDPDLSLALAVQGLIYSDEMDFDAAEASLRRAIAVNPSEGIFYSWLSTVIEGKGDVDEAVSVLNQAFQIDPLHPAIRNNLANLEVEKGNYGKAREMITPDTAQAYLIEAFISINKGAYAAMRDNLENSMALREKGGLARGSMLAAGFSFFLLGSTGEETAHLPPETRLAMQALSVDHSRARAVLEEIPQDARGDWYHYTLAWLQLLDGEGAQAQYTLQQVFDPALPVYTSAASFFSSADYATLYAFALRQQGQDEAAAELVNRVLELVERGQQSGAAPGAYSRLAAESYAVLGDVDNAVGALKTGWSYYRVGWLDFESPMLLSLGKNPEIDELHSAVIAHVNAEREKLGWEAMQLAAR